VTIASSAAEVEALYQELILDHYRRPRNRGELPHPDAAAALRNPLCGDELAIALALDGDVVREARFAGRGCSLSQASASMMTELVRGRTRREVRDLDRRFRALVRGDRGSEDVEQGALGPLRAFAGVARLPSRHRCALLPWDALERALASRPDGTRAAARSGGRAR
jgi:nitrogen fixation protein NifU and related proteins